MKVARIMVTGSRPPLTTGHESLVREFLGMATETFPEAERFALIHGAASGVDTVAAEHAKTLDWTIEPYPAKWKELGKAAGLLRNQEMVDTEPDWALAFPGPKSRGTYDAIRRCHKAGVLLTIKPLTPDPMVYIIPAHKVDTDHLELILAHIRGEF